MADVHGWTADGFEGVRDAFVANFDGGSEVGAAFSAYHRGQKVVDLWGGVADPATGRPWEEDTLILVFSSTKGVTAMAANQLAQEGRLDVEAPVATYWPEFARNGKDDVTVAHLLSHQAGLAWVDGEMSLEEMLSWEPVIEALQDQKPHWEPGTEHGYHATTYGWLVGEVIRRVSGQRVGAYVAEHLAGPLGADFWIGLPEAEEGRVAPLLSMFPPGLAVTDLTADSENPIAQMMAAFLGPETELGKALFAPGFAMKEFEAYNSREVRAAEIPAANGVCDARSLARLYAACVSDVDGIRLLTPEQVTKATTQRTEGPNRILMGMDIQFGLGFMLHSSLIALGGDQSFGHFGAGGSVGWADPDAELAVGYVMNRMDIGLAGDLRSFNLINACYDAIG